MSLGSFGFILCGVILNALAQLCLKASTNAVGPIPLQGGDWLATGLALAAQPPLIAGLSCYALSVLVWLIGLSRVDVSIAYPMLSLGYVLNAAGAWYFLGEDLSLQRMAGIGIIVAGVALLARS